jgi:glycosyltransferase involved in cell wall biosynthesis
MRIGIDARAAQRYRGTGLGTYTHQLIRHLGHIDRLNEYTLFCAGEAPLGSEFPDEARFCEARFPAAFDRGEEDARIGKELAERTFAVHHVPHNGLGLPQAKSCPFVVTVHDLIPYVFPQTCSPRYLTRFLDRMPAIVEMADVIITVSRHTKEDLRTILQVPEEKLVVTYEAPEPCYRPIDKEAARQLVAEKYGVAGPFILNVGGFSLRKNLNGLIIAYAAASSDLPDRPELVIAGKCEANAERLRELAKKLGVDDRVHFPGFVPFEDLPYLYNAASCFVYPSLYEGFGLPPLEAMACGVPVITSMESSLPEVVGDAALSVDAYDPDQIAGAIARLLASPELQSLLARKGLARAAQFTWRKTAQQTLLVYQTIAR